MKSLLMDRTAGTSADTRMEQKSDSNLIENELLLENLRESERIKASRGMSSHGYKDSRLNHPPRNRAKEDPEEAMIRGMY